uniref:DUF2795 domain-containing protein n=1 Tax=Streptomyces sp. NBC_00003 TaxID=2903608 RepID=A0AAU2UY34_9ACTN
MTSKQPESLDDFGTSAVKDRLRNVGLTCMDTQGNEHQAIKKWPATKMDILNAAKAGGESRERLDALARLPKDTYQDATELITDLPKT